MERFVRMGRSFRIPLLTLLLAGELAAPLINHFTTHLSQESRVITTNDLVFTYELHVIRAHLLHYTSLLRDFRKSVEFVRDTHNPAMDSDDITDEQRKNDRDLLNSESANLLSEVERLEVSRNMLDDRVQNVTHLVCDLTFWHDTRRPD